MDNVNMIKNETIVSLLFNKCILVTNIVVYFQFSTPFSTPYGVLGVPISEVPQKCNLSVLNKYDVAS